MPDEMSNEGRHVTVDGDLAGWLVTTVRLEMLPDPAGTGS